MFWQLGTQEQREILNKANPSIIGSLVEDKYENVSLTEIIAFYGFLLTYNDRSLFKSPHFPGA